LVQFVLVRIQVGQPKFKITHWFSMSYFFAPTQNGIFLPDFPPK